jgi:hypothetical protein
MSDTEDSTPAPAARGAGLAPGRRPPGDSLRSRRFGPTALVALVALIALGVWLVVEYSGNKSDATTPTATSSSSPGLGPVAFSLSRLRTFAKTAGTPIYWVGERPNTTYEVTRNSKGVYVRYLPAGAKAGYSKPVLTVGTYPFQNAYEITKKSPKAPDTVVKDIKGGGIAVYDKKHPMNVYVAYPGSAFQVEVYGPSARVVRQLATSGRVQPVLESTQTQPQARTPAAVSRLELTVVATNLGHPIYWAGPRPNTTYELWQTARGYTYIRYLPKGVAVGSGGGRYLIVGTYPMKDAFAVTRKSAAKGKDTVRIKLPDGGIAAYAKKHATNVYVAYPGVDVQVEVYDPSATLTPKLVASGQIVPVR